MQEKFSKNSKYFSFYNNIHFESCFMTSSTFWPPWDPNCWTKNYQTWFLKSWWTCEPACIKKFRNLWTQKVFAPL